MKNDLVFANTPIHIFINIDYSFCSWQLAAFRSHEKIEDDMTFKHLLRELADTKFLLLAAVIYTCILYILATCNLSTTHSRQNFEIQYYCN